MPYRDHPAIATLKDNPKTHAHGVAACLVDIMETDMADFLMLIDGEETSAALQGAPYNYTVAQADALKNMAAFITTHKATLEGYRNDLA